MTSKAESIRRGLEEAVAYADSFSANHRKADLSVSCRNFASYVLRPLIGSLPETLVRERMSGAGFEVALECRGLALIREGDLGHNPPGLELRGM